MFTIQKIEENIISVSAEITLEKLYQQLNGFELFIEPLSQKKTLKDFIAEGGLGYNSLKEGTFSSKIYKIKNKINKSYFEYGSNNMSLYNVGYPLHRIVDNPFFNLTKVDFGTIEKITLPIRKKQNIKITYIKKDTNIIIPEFATNVIYVNNIGANLLGLNESGIIIFHPNEFQLDGELKNEIEKKKFIEDFIPKENCTLKILTMKSNLPKIYELAEKNNSLFFALFTNLGILVLISSNEEKIKEIKNSINYPMTWFLTK
ncbi:MAG: hypothetical protein ABIB46_02575 [bacterium]